MSVNVSVPCVSKMYNAQLFGKIKRLNERDICCQIEVYEIQHNRLAFYNTHSKGRKILEVILK